MKASRWSVFGLQFILILSGCNGCTPEECQSGFELADLLVNEKTVDLVSQDTSSTTYEIIHVVLNSAEAIICNRNKLECDAVAPADTSSFQVNIFYNDSTANPTTWGNSINSFSNSLQQIVGCENASVSDYLQFLQDGYYLIRGTIDIFNSVSERNEGNNTEDTGASGKSLAHPATIIHVQRGLRSHEYFEGKPVLVKRVKSSVTYY